MNKIINFLGLIVISGILLYFYLKKEPPVIVKKIQNENCFCSPPKEMTFTACFHPAGEYAVWDSNFNLALAPFKIPLKTGTWKRLKDEINILFTDGRSINIPHNSETDGLYPESLDFEGLFLKPDYCQNLNWSDLPKYFQSNKDSAYICTDGKIGTKLNIQINFKENSFNTWTGETLSVKESIFFEPPSKKGIFKIDGDLITFTFDDGLVRNGKIIERNIESKIPEIIEFVSGDQAIVADKGKCEWLKKSLTETFLITSKNKYCEKNHRNDFAVILPDQKINMYINTENFTLNDFLTNKYTFQGTKLLLTGNKISFSLKEKTREGIYEKVDDKITSFKFKSGKPGEWAEYSNEYCTPFFLSDKLWKKK